MNQSQPATASDHEWMQRALDLAEWGAYSTRPNPRVGCVLVKEGRRIGEGWHERAGGPHAEVHALRASGDARGATAYVTLEPCSHSGRTPPCVLALIGAGVARVVVATVDPFPSVAGQGIRQLQEAGIRVDVGIHATQARFLNLGFFSRIERKRPWLRVKLAHSLDGRTALADGRSQWLTDTAARDDGHRWRARACAVMTGIGTVLADNPRLSTRLPETDQGSGYASLAPQRRIIVDPMLRTPADARIFDDGVTVIIAHRATTAPPPDYPSHVELLPVPELPLSGHMDLAHLCAVLSARWQMQEVHVEAGPRLSGSLMQQGLVDEALLYQTPKLLGTNALPLFDIQEPASLAAAPRAWCRQRRVLGPDLCQLMTFAADHEGRFVSGMETPD